MFDRRLRLPGNPRGCWIVLRYRMDALAPPLRPMVRLLLRARPRQDFVLPGVVLDGAAWLGMLPHDLTEIRLAAPAGFVLERVGLRRHAGLLAQCLVERPIRFVPTLYAALRRDERRYRDILRGARAVTPMSCYSAWRATRLREPGPDAAGAQPAICLILPAAVADEAGVARTIESLRAQTHRAWTLVVARTGAERTVAADARVTEQGWDEEPAAGTLLGGADALGFLRPGDVLRADALAVLAARLAAADAPDLVYADDEVESPTLRPRLKPDWSPDLARVSGYHENLCLLAGKLVARLGSVAAGPADGRAIALAAATAAERVAHVPRVLCRSRDHAFDATARGTALALHLAAIGSPARAEVVDGVLDLRWPVPDPAPLVSVVIPSRDRLDLIGRVSADVLTQTDYPALQLVIVDNGSTDPGVLDLYERLRADPRVRVLAYPHAFDFSAMVNAGARAADGAILVLLNNDIRVLEPGWLRAMVGQAVRPEVGAVGAKLLYADGRLQHAGVVVGLGGYAGHVLRRRPGDSPGHLDRMRVAHEVSAVTAACLAVAREKFEAVGGLDAEAFAIDFNDVDLCLRLAARGWKSMWTPKAVLSHLESVSRGPPVGLARRRFEREAEAFAARWRETIRHDPFYHPGLSLTTFGEDLE